MLRRLRTSLAGPKLGYSQGHLKRLMEDKRGPLQKTKRYLLGPTKNSPIQWDVEACRQEFDRLGMLRREADQNHREGGLSEKKLSENTYRTKT